MVPLKYRTVAIQNSGRVPSISTGHHSSAGAVTISGLLGLIVGQAFYVIW